MSCHVIYYENGAKMMRPVLTAAEYRNLRNTEKQKTIVASTRNGDDKMKHRLLQMNYSCIPSTNDNDALRYDNDNCLAGCGPLKGCTTPSTTVGMDVDHIAKHQMQEVKERILTKKDELGLLMLELSARGEGYHLVFRRKAELSQEDNLRWASNLLGVEFDKGAKDITRVFFTTTASEEDLLFLDDELFNTEAVELEANTILTNDTNVMAEEKKDSADSSNSCSTIDVNLDYLGISGPIGKEIDSLADAVSFGIAPAILAYQIARNVYGPGEPNAIDFALAMLMAAFSALRLAKFNCDERQTLSFIGLPTPSNALFWIGLTFVCRLDGVHAWLTSLNPEVFGCLWFAVILCMSFLLISEIPMFSLKLKKGHNGFAENKARYIFLGLTAVILIVSSILGLEYFAASPALIILLYILLSITIKS